MIVFPEHLVQAIACNVSSVLCRSLSRRRDNSNSLTDKLDASYFAVVLMRQIVSPETQFKLRRQATVGGY